MICQCDGNDSFLLLFVFFNFFLNFVTKDWILNRGEIVIWKKDSEVLGILI